MIEEPFSSGFSYEIGSPLNRFKKTSKKTILVKTEKPKIHHTLQSEMKYENNPTKMHPPMYLRLSV
jgi:hypothetical protein